MKIFSKKTIDKIFEIGVLIKALFGFVEILTGLAIALAGKLIVDNLLIALTQQEILEDPHDRVASALIKIGNSFSLFAIVYLIFHGVMNIFLVMALLKKKFWAYYLAIAAISFFIVYQIYRYFHIYSIILLCLTVFDIFFVAIIFLEYRKLKKKA